MKTCIINLGLYRSGITTLAVAAGSLGLDVHREFPAGLDSETMRELLLNPKNAVRSWWSIGGGSTAIMDLVTRKDFLCDGWFALMVFLSRESLLEFKDSCRVKLGVTVHFVATFRNVNQIVESELHHWVRHDDLERKCGLSSIERQFLEASLFYRATAHNALAQTVLDASRILHLDDIVIWPKKLSAFTHIIRSQAWERALLEAGSQNVNPPRPVEGILLTLRMGTEARLNIECMLSALEEDSLCSYLVVLAVDHDECECDDLSLLLDVLRMHGGRQARPVQVIVNEEPVNEEKPFAICKVWDRMAKLAWTSGADWVMLLGDDIEIHSAYHYRCIYRAFLDIQEKFQCPFGFGCPWWNDLSFPGFPTFPIVGKEHLQIFGALIPLHRSESFWNQDLDPYLQRLYLKYGAAPLLQDAILLNKSGGNDQTPARYHRISANGWRDWVLQDCHRLGSYLAELLPIAPPTIMLVDVGIPTYRLNLKYLVTLCSLKVPDDWRTTFIIIVDNPTHLLKVAKDCCGMIAKNGELTVQRSAKCLEDYLIRRTASNGVSNNIRVRVNVTNLGASASRNRALDESSSEYMLFLDDDVIPSPSLLAFYRNWMNEHDIEQQTKVLGLIGMVKFPRFQLPLLHAAVLMSYLTFAFEIAAMPNYENPAWGVTANLMVKRLPNMRFDTSYAKTGGGEDVDFCLRMGKDVDGGTFRSVPAAVVEHPFWRGNFLSLSSHFFNWACGDSGLFSRFPEHCFRSWPNASETMVLGSALFLLLSPLCDQSWLCSAWRWALFCLSVCAVDVAIDTCDIQGFQHRSKLLEGSYPLSFRILSNFLGNAYVIILECGRLWGHVKHGAWRSIGLRFDWHCGRIECHRSNFRDKELLKFSGFVAVLFAVACHTDVPVFNTYHGQYP